MIVRKTLDQAEPSFKPYVLEICVGTAKDHSILCALFCEGLATYGVPKHELSKIKSGIFSCITK